MVVPQKVLLGFLSALITKPLTLFDPGLVLRRYEECRLSNADLADMPHDLSVVL